jgi:squalene-hopene/tetraprenyl-beta-curcumene cyclase
MKRPCGTYGAYTVSTLYSLITLQDWQENYPTYIKDNLKFEADFKLSLEAVEDLCFNSDSSSYLGVVVEGRWWDTLLVTLGLLETNEDSQKLIPVVKNFLKNGVQECGGISYGLDLSYAPDTDDTGVLAIILAKYFKDVYAENLKKANEWLIRMQNSDGGFGAFARNNYNWFFIRAFAGKFDNSAELVDDSSVDVTAHILEGWALSGYRLSDSHVKKAIGYIQSKQTSFGAWEGRWGCNYIYSVGAVWSALGQFKDFQIKEEKWLLKSIYWLVKCQNNDDGGFGESNQSYTNLSWIGRGKSTPSQTAWALLALIEAKRAQIDVDGIYF